jgi:hypothetical protein
VAEKDATVQNVFPDLHIRKGGSSPLPPPFLVPAIIEALKLSDKYSSVTSVVAGEADSFCAGHVSVNGGIVLTQDSDLLAHELGPGSVVFLRDVHYGDLSGRRGLVAAKFEPRIIANRLGIPAEEGICRLAFELSNDLHATISQLTQRCSSAIGSEKAYNDFARQYRNTPLPNRDPDLTVTLLHSTVVDPRVSELLIQLSVNEDNSPGSMSPLSRQRVMMFLPVLLDCPSATSAWENSTLIRQLSYSLARVLGTNPISSIREFRRIQSTSNPGKDIGVLSQEEITLQAISLAAFLDTACNEIVEDNFLWPAICLAQDLQSSQFEDKESFFAKVISNNLESAEMVSWDLIHVAAQVQACCYSFRMLRQVIIAIRNVGASLPEGVLNLNISFDRLPELVDFPTLDSVSAFITQCQEPRSFASVLKTVSLPETFMTLLTAKTRRQNKKGKAGSASSRTGKTTTSSNPYQVLSPECKSFKVGQNKTSIQTSHSKETQRPPVLLQ